MSGNIRQGCFPDGIPVLERLRLPPIERVVNQCGASSGGDGAPLVLPRPLMQPLRQDDASLCPSAQPSAEGVAVFAVIQGTATEPRAAYLDRLVPLTPEIAATAAPVDPREVFRMSAPCASHGCRHFGEGRCSLVTRLVQLVPSVVTSAPPCMVRPHCMWWRQEGVEACMRCPQVVTHMYGAGAQLVEAATPPEPAV